MTAEQQQQAQRDKLIGLAQNWVNAHGNFRLSGNLFYHDKAIIEKRKFVDYVEHMHDELAQSDALAEDRRQALEYLQFVNDKVQLPSEIATNE